MIYRYSRKAVRLAGDVAPYVSPRWFLEVTFLPRVRQDAILDVLDLNTCFLIAPDVVPDYAEKDRESVVQKALRITGSTPDILVLDLGLTGECADVDNEVVFPNINLPDDQRALLQNFRDIKIARTNLLSRRLNFDSAANCRLISDAWRVSYNFLGSIKPAGCCQYHCWLDIVNAAGDSA
jgi:hypothetical protein